MSFYLQPPKGNVALNKLSHFVHTRLSFLARILDAEGDRMKLQDMFTEMALVKESECLIEGTAKDNISHFVLRLACCQVPDMVVFFVNAETALFDWRFSCMSESELCNLLKSLDPYLPRETSHSYRVTRATSNQELITDILLILSNIKQECRKWRTVVKKYLNGEMSQCFRIPFQYVLSLVRKREVRLSRGIASVPFYRLRLVMTRLFSKLLQIGLEEARNKVITEDERILGLIRAVKVIFRHRYRQTDVPIHHFYQTVSHHDVDRLVQYFPPCMAHALHTLRKKHRLSHHTRIQLTLFLKEIGLPVHEALILWKDEYSKPACNHGNGCSHDWVPNERRYTYNIRHLYGLEGSRTNYKGHSCKYLQEDFQGHREEGGCVFSRFDKENITKILTTTGFHGNCETIIQHAVNGNFGLACNESLQILYNKKRHQLHCNTNHSDEQLEYKNCDCPSQNNNCLPNNNKVKTANSINGNTPPNDVLYKGPCSHLEGNAALLSNNLKKDISNPGQFKTTCSYGDSDSCSGSSDQIQCDQCNSLQQSIKPSCERSSNERVCVKKQGANFLDCGEAEMTYSMDLKLDKTILTRKQCKPIDYYDSYRNLVEKLHDAG